MKTRRILHLLSFALVLLLSYPVLGADRGKIYSGETKVGFDIDSPSYLDTWAFEDGQIGDRIVISVEAVSGALDPWIKLYPPGGGPAEGSGHETLTHQLEQSGTYTVFVYDWFYDHSGTYNITLLDLPDGPVTSSNDPTGGGIESGQTLSGAIDVASDMDAFQFYGETNDRVVISVEATSGDLDPWIKLYPPDGGPAEGTGHETLTHQLEQSGIYTVVIYDWFYDHTGTYNITLLDLQDFAPADFEPDGEVDMNDLKMFCTYWLYSGCHEPNWCSGTDINQDEQVDFPDFAIFADYWQAIAIASREDRDGGTIISGETLSGTVNVASDMDGFQFYGKPNDRVVISVEATSGDLDPWIKLYPPDGGPAEDSGHETLDHQLEQSGIYTVVIYDWFYDHTGTYNITLLDLPDGPVLSTDDPDGGPISSGQMLQGQIDVASDMDAFQFEGQINDRVLVSVQATSGSLDPWIKLYPPDGGPAEDSGHETLDHQLEQSGTYTIVVYDWWYDDEGSYNISFTNLE